MEIAGSARAGPRVGCSWVRLCPSCAGACCETVSRLDPLLVTCTVCNTSWKSICSARGLQAGERHMRVEYAPEGTVGVLTPQANTTVEPEYAILTPPGYAWINARMLSPHKTIEERLVDYFSKVPQYAPQFANAPIEALSFACTGTSYLVGKESEDDVARRGRQPAARAGDERGDLCVPRARHARRQAHRPRLALSGGAAARHGLHALLGIARVRDRREDERVAARRKNSIRSTPAVRLRAARRWRKWATTRSMPSSCWAPACRPSRPSRARPITGGIPVFSCMFALIWANIVAVDRARADGGGPARRGCAARGGASEWACRPSRAEARGAPRAARPRPLRRSWRYRRRRIA